MKQYIFILLFIFSSAFSAASENECFKVGDNWHDLTLPNDMKNVKWLFGDDENRTPFMSVTFNIDGQEFERWAVSCNVDIKEIKKNGFWSRDIELSSGGFISIVKYKSNRYCIGVERSAQPEAVKKVNGKSYFGCPIRGNIDY